jgi:hypothetical protein
MRKSWRIGSDAVTPSVHFFRLFLQIISLDYFTDQINCFLCEIVILFQMKQKYIRIK